MKRGNGLERKKVWGGKKFDSSGRALGEKLELTIIEKDHEGRFIMHLVTRMFF